jgi:zinc/manganese transport system substrate-binding protein
MPDKAPAHPRRVRSGIAVVAIVIALAAGACGGTAATVKPAGPSVVVTTSVLGAVVQDLVGDRAAAAVLMGNGVDPHDWEPSAKDIERVMGADLVVTNGLGLEESLEKTLDEAEAAGVPVFHATDHITVREIADDVDDAAADDERGPGDPHFWVDPLSMQAVVAALAPELAAVGIDVADRAADLEARLGDLDTEVRSTLVAVPEANRKLVTGHESMGYFADRYGFQLIGTVVPGLSSQGEVSAGELSELRRTIDATGVPAIFAEVGTPAAVVAAIGDETGAAVVQLPSHIIPDDGSYVTFVRHIATTVAEALG